MKNMYAMHELSALITSQINLNYNSTFLVKKYTAAISEQKLNKVQPQSLPNIECYFRYEHC